MDIYIKKESWKKKNFVTSLLMNLISKYQSILILSGPESVVGKNTYNKLMPRDLLDSTKSLLVPYSGDLGLCHINEQVVFRDSAPI